MGTAQVAFLPGVDMFGLGKKKESPNERARKINRKLKETFGAGNPFPDGTQKGLDEIKRRFKDGKISLTDMTSACAPMKKVSE